MKTNKIFKIILMSILFFSIHIISANAMTPEDIAFDSDYYLSQHKDIQDVIGNNKERLKAHFYNNGIYEGRKSSMFFDVQYYLNRYEDLSQAYGKDFAGAYRHFIQYGLNEGRMGAPGFDVDYYISHNPDVQAKYPTRILAYEHFINYGIYEGRSTTSGFNATYYLLTHTDLQNAFGNNKYSAFEHFINYGIYEGRVSSSNYEGTWYLNKYKDLQNHYGNNYVFVYNHYLTWGIKENRQAISKNRVDLVAPLISGVKNETIYVKLNDSKFSLPSVTAEDAVDGKVTVKVTGEVNIRVENTYKITYTATDNAKNTSSVTLTVIVTRRLPATKTIESGIYQIQSELNNGIVLDVSNGSLDNFANIQTWENVGARQQKFYVIYLGDGYYEIKAVHSGKVLDIDSSGTNVYQYSSNRSDAQKWIIQDAGNGYFNIISKWNDLFLDISRSSCYKWKQYTSLG